MLNMLSSDTTRDFLLDYINEMSEFDTASYAHMKGAVSLTEKVVEFPGINNGLDCQTIIRRSLDDLSKMIETGDVPSLTAFYNNIRDNIVDDINDISIVIPNLNEIDKIRPQFLTAYVENFRNTLIMHLKGSVDEERLKRMVSAEVLEQTKRQICKSTINSTYDLKDVAKLVNGEHVVIDSEYITANIIPFLKGLATDFKGLARDAALTIDAIRAASNAMGDTIKAYNDMTVDHKVDAKMTLFVYKATKNFLALRSYAAFLMTRKIITYTNTLLAYEDLYNVIFTRHPEGERILHESVLDGELNKDIEDYDVYHDVVDGEGNMIAAKIRSIVDNRNYDIANFSNGTIGYNVLNIEGSEGKYDKDSYQSIIEIFESFTSRINDFVNAIMAGDIFDDAQTHSGFDQTLSIKYSSVISKFSEVTASDFTAKSSLAIDQLVAVYSELVEMEQNTWNIKESVRKARNAFDEDVRMLADAKQSQDEVSDAVLDEALQFMENMDKQFKDLVVQVYKAIYHRLINLDDSISVIINSYGNNTIIATESIDEPFDCDSIINEMMIEEAEQRAILAMKECAKDYIQARTYNEERRHVVFEADTVASDTASSNTQTSNSNDKSTLMDKLKAIGHAIAEFFRKLFSRVQTDVDKAISDNAKWFAQYEDAIKNADVSNLSVRILPYKDSMISQATTDIENVKNKILNMKPDEFKRLAKDKNALRDLVYKDIPYKKVVTGDSKRGKKTGDGFNAVIRQYYAIGTDKKEDNAPLAPDVLKARIPIMIEYCKSYKNTVNELSTRCTAAAKAIDAKLADVANADGGKTNTNESAHAVIDGGLFIFEADSKAADTTTGESKPAQQSSPAAASANASQNDRDKSSTKPSVEVKADANSNVGGDQDVKFTATDGYNAANAVSKDFMTYASSIATSYRDRYIAYMDVMKKIVNALGLSGKQTEKDSSKSEAEKAAEDKKNGET